MKKIKLLLISIFALVPIYISTPVASAWNPFAQACQQSANNAICSDTNKAIGGTDPVSGPKGVIHEATNVFALVTIVAGLIITLYSAFVFVTAGGARAGDNASRARQARTTMTSAITGIIIVSLAWLIVTYVTTHVIH